MPFVFQSEPTPEGQLPGETESSSVSPDAENSAPAENTGAADSTGKNTMPRCSITWRHAHT